ncbi:unnamed protein product [Trichogramma brassicae]|uniref:Uncharacterized protein n=1 Tax=Trichogramma brassicae TaxID=86971 RepID=A0A6H5J187_9HYME|nr:unnamed protein product [Trichogramma brassicae]
MLFLGNRRITLAWVVYTPLTKSICVNGTSEPSFRDSHTSTPLHDLHRPERKTSAPKPELRLSVVVHSSAEEIVAYFMMKLLTIYASFSVKTLQFFAKLLQKCVIEKTRTSNTRAGALRRTFTPDRVRELHCRRRARTGMT